MRIKRSALLVLLSACTMTATASAQTGPELKSLVEGNTDFALALYQRLGAKEGNLFFSPYSISNALAMTYAGARGNTAEEMKHTLRFHLGDDRLHPAFAGLIAKLEGGGKKRPFELTVANRLWGQKDYGFLPDFIKVGRDHYGAGLEEVDFIRATEAARQTINAWVEKQTRDRIKDLIPEGVLDDLSRLVLTNAIYFKAAWRQPFDPKRTEPAAFHLGTGATVKVPMMQANDRGLFADFDTFSMLRLPYEDGGQSMLLLLPKAKDGLAALEKRLTGANLAKWSGKLSTHVVDLKMPKFKLSAQFRLDEVLKEMGMKDAFVFGKADFSGMATREKLYITAVLHKAFVDVNEAGTEAAAATAVVIGTRSLPPRASFHADHPFLFLIQDDATGTVLFAGRVANPS